MDNLSSDFPVVLAEQVLRLEQVRTGFRSGLDPELTDLVQQRLTWALMRFNGTDPYARMGSEAYSRLRSIIHRNEGTTIIQSPPPIQIDPGGASGGTSGGGTSGGGGGGIIKGGRIMD